MILAIRTDSPTVYFKLFSKDGDEVGEQEWLAERRLARELLSALENFLEKNGADWEALTGLVVHAGPGSFTGLRIGITVMNTIAYAQELPIVGVTGDDWGRKGIDRLFNGENDQMVLPEYGAPARITSPRK